jgi:protoporphyrinogen oxidase
MKEPHAFVIAGAGLAGVRAARTLRKTFSPIWRQT